MEIRREKCRRREEVEREKDGEVRIHPPTRKSRGGHVDLTGEYDSDIYPAPQLVSRPIRVIV